MKYTVELSVKQLLREPACKKVLEEQLPKVIPMIQNQENAQGLSLRKLAEYLTQFLSPEKLEQIDAALLEVSLPEGMLSESEQKK